MTTITVRSAKWPGIQVYKVFALSPDGGMAAFQQMKSVSHTSHVWCNALRPLLPSYLGQHQLPSRPPASRHVASHADAPAALLQRRHVLGIWMLNGQLKATLLLVAISLFCLPLLP